MSDIKTKDIEAFGRFLISLGCIYNVDEEGYICDKIDIDEPVLHKVGTQYKRIMILQEVIKDRDALVINPLNENITESADSRWLYTMLNMGLVRRVIDVARFLASTNELSKSGEEIDMSSEVIKFASRHKDFDAKVLEHFEHIAKKKIAFISIWYNRKFKEAKFRCSIYDPDTAAEFPSVPKKVWKIIGAFIGELFGLSADLEKASSEINEKYSTSSDLISVAKLESVLKVYFKIYKHMNKFLDMCEMMDDEDFIVDLTSFGIHLNNLEGYYQKAKWFTPTCADINTRPTVRPIEGAIPVVASNIPSNPTISSHVGYTELESNIPSNPRKLGGDVGILGIPSNPGLFNQPVYPNQNIIPVGNRNMFGNNPIFVGNTIPTNNFTSGFNIPLI